MAIMVIVALLVLLASLMVVLDGGTLIDGVLGASVITIILIGPPVMYDIYRQTSAASPNKAKEISATVDVPAPAPTLKP